MAKRSVWTTISRLKRAAAIAAALPVMLCVLAIIAADGTAQSSGMRSEAEARANDSGGFALPSWVRDLFDPVGRRSAGMPTHLIIGLDLSKSKPLVEDQEFASKIGDYVAAEMLNLPVKSRVWLRTFGVDSAQANALRHDRVIRADVSSEETGSFFRTLISGMPTLVARGTVQAQDFTNIVSFLRNMAQVTDCSANTTRIILATDALEDSEIVRLKTPNSELPAPRSGLFEGCEELLILGIGQGQDSPNTTTRLRKEWQSWAQTAGFRNFRALNNW